VKKTRPVIKNRVFLQALYAFLLFGYGTAAGETETVLSRPVRVSANFAQTFRCPNGRNAIVLQTDCRIECGEIRFSSDEAVVWISRTLDTVGKIGSESYQITLFLRGGIQSEPDSWKLERFSEDPQSAGTRLRTTAQVYLTAETLLDKPGFELPIYQAAQRLGFAADMGQDAAAKNVAPKARIQAEEKQETAIRMEPAKIPAAAPAELPPAEPPAQTAPTKEKKIARPSAPESPFPEIPRVHPVFLGPVESQPQPDGTDILTCTDGIYIYQQRPAENRLLELRARNAVVFYSQKKIQDESQQWISAIEGVYLEGDVVFQMGDYQITANSLYYDFEGDGALVLDGVLSLMVPDSSLPVYVRAKEIRQISKTHFAAKQVKLSTDEFYQPHVYAGVEEVDILTEDKTGREPQTYSEVERINYDMKNASTHVEGLPVFWWPRLKGATATPEAPLKTIHTSNSSEYGFGVETEWHLARMLGLKEPSGVETTFRLDEFTKRGPAAGVDAEYVREHYFGNLKTYLVADDGEDRLGRADFRKDVPVEHDTRGRAQWQHRHYFTRDWEATVEVAYVSDPEFLESWEKRDFDTEKEPETLLNLKHSRDNWAFEFLNKFHLNDFEYTQTELPTAGFHIAGQDILEKFTYSHDGYISRIRERAGGRDVPGLTERFEPWLLPGAIDQDDYAFATSRHELSLPLHVWDFQVAPTVIGTYHYDDAAETRSNSTVQGAGGLRTSTQLWHVDDSVQSRFFDLDRLRHEITPEASAFWIDSDEADVVHQDVFNFGLRQRWQTMRGPKDKKFSTEFLRWNTDVTLVTNDVDNAPVPNSYFFSTPEPQFEKRPYINPDFFNLGLARRELVNQTFSDHVRSDWSWMISDSTEVLGDVNYNIHDGDLSRIGTAVAVQRTPRLSYYIGARFLKEGDLYEDDDSNVLTGGTSYQLNKKYTVALSQQFDVADGDSAHTQVVIIRKFVHWYGAFNVGYDPVREDMSISVSFWPEGLDKVALGSRRFSRLTR